MTKKDLMIQRTKKTWKALVNSYITHMTLLICTTICLIIFLKILRGNSANLGEAATILIASISGFLYMVLFGAVLISALERIDAEMQQLINYISVGADFTYMLAHAKPSHKIEREIVTNFDNSVGRRIPNEELDDYGYMELSDKETDCYCHGELIRHEESIEGIEID